MLLLRPWRRFQKESCCTGWKELCRSLTNGNWAPGCHECRSQNSATLMESWGKHEQQQREQSARIFLACFLFSFLWLWQCCVCPSSNKGADIWPGIWPPCVSHRLLRLFDLRSESSSIHVNAPSDRRATTCADRRCCRYHIPAGLDIHHCVYIIFSTLWIAICKVVYWIFCCKS